MPGNNSINVPSKHHSTSKIPHNPGMRAWQGCSLAGNTTAPDIPRPDKGQDQDTGFQILGHCASYLECMEKMGEFDQANCRAPGTTGANWLRLNQTPFAPVASLEAKAKVGRVPRSQRHTKPHLCASAMAQSVHSHAPPNAGGRAHAWACVFWSAQAQWCGGVATRRAPFLAGVGPARRRFKSSNARS